MYCDTCGASKKYYKGVFGVCGRTQLLRNYSFIDLEELFKFEIKNIYSVPLNIKTPFIPVLDRDIIKYRIPDLFPKVDAWVVLLQDIYNKVKKDFKSRDIKDYLNIAANKKLILSTNSTDDYQEILWNRYRDYDFTNINIDYWFPGHFSIYDNDNKLYQFVNAKRQQIHAQLSHSQFVWFRLGENIPLKFMEPVKNAKNILISTNNMKSELNLNILKKEIKAADNWFPTDASFYAVGSIKNFPKLRKERKYYVIGIDWCKKARFGKNLDGKIETRFDKSQSKELLILNLNKEIENASKKHSSLYGRGIAGAKVAERGLWEN